MACQHFQQVERGFGLIPKGYFCEDCVKIGGRWVHLRMCLSCGHVGCCDSSPHRHARAHFSEKSHPIIRSVEPGETWAFCFQDNAYGKDLRLQPIDWSSVHANP